jgi:hypothetical protein
MNWLWPQRAVSGILESRPKMDSVLRVMLALMLGFPLLVSVAWLLFRTGPVTGPAGTQHR